MGSSERHWILQQPRGKSGLVLTMWSIAVLKNHREPLTGSGDDGGWRRAAGF